MAKIITLRYAGTCADCGTALPVGMRAKWYKGGKVYGLECHTRDGLRRLPSGETVDAHGRTGWVATFSDGSEAYQNYNGRCEDAPCCGCCG